MADLRAPPRDPLVDWRSKCLACHRFVRWNTSASGKGAVLKDCGPAFLAYSTRNLPDAARDLVQFVVVASSRNSPSDLSTIHPH